MLRANHVTPALQSVKGYTPAAIYVMCYEVHTMMRANHVTPALKVLLQDIRGISNRPGLGF